MIAGHEVIDQGDTVFDHIPLVPFIGDETVYEGKLDRKGQTRSLIDAQRMYNYSATSYVEFVALQTKAPWLGDNRAFEGYEDQWAAANTGSAAFLPFNSFDQESQQPIPPPQRIEPPPVNGAHVQGMQTAEHQMQMVSGQYDAEMGAQSNERTGVAIQQRQRQGETATYHFTDAQGAALRLLGKILIGAVPKVYDTQRAIQILGEDGNRTAAVIDPSLPTAHANVPPPGSDDPDHEDAILAVNPTIGRYDVEADVGPAYGTRVGRKRSTRCRRSCRRRRWWLRRRETCCSRSWTCPWPMRSPSAWHHRPPIRTWQRRRRRFSTSSSSSRRQRRS